jgi:hypothetical protein
VLGIVDAGSIARIQRAHRLPIGQVRKHLPAIDAVDAFEKDDLLATTTVETLHVPA